MQRKNRSKKQEARSKKIIGVLSDKTISSSKLKELSKKFSKIDKNYVCLPFKVEPKYLQNVIDCMRLMDIEMTVVL